MIRWPASPPGRFFRPEASDVLKDFYDGNGASVNKLLSHSEVAIVMYYAPWSLESRQARPVYEIVARSFSSNPQVLTYELRDSHYF